MLASGVGEAAEEWGRRLIAPVSCVVGAHARAHAQARLSAGGGLERTKSRNAPPRPENATDPAATPAGLPASALTPARTGVKPGARGPRWR